MNELIVLLPAFNEEENLESLVHSWQTFRKGLAEGYGLALHIVVVNDGSGDKTPKIGEALAYRYDNVTLLSHQRNCGLGQALKTGIFHVLRQHPDGAFVCLMDCDNTHHPKYVLDMLDKQQATAADVVIASRYEEGAEVYGLSAFRRFLSEAARSVYTLLLHVDQVRDYTCGYRLYRAEALRKAYDRFGEDLVEERGFSCMAELLYKLYSCGAVFAEVPFDLRYDLKGGASKMKVIQTVVNSMKLVARLKGIAKQGSAPYGRKSNPTTREKVL